MNNNISMIDRQNPIKEKPKGMEYYFNSDWYLEEYPEARDLIYQRAYRDAFDHYIQIGARKGNSPHPNFDEEFYLQANEDVRKAMDSGEVQCGYHHFLAFGEAEGRPAKPLSTDEKDARQALISIFDGTNG